MKYVYQVTISDGSDFDRLKAERFFTTEDVAHQWGDERERELRAEMAPMFQRSLDVRVIRHDVFEEAE